MIYLQNYTYSVFDFVFNLLNILEFRDANMESCLKHYWKTFSSYIGKFYLKGSQLLFLVMLAV